MLKALRHIDPSQAEDILSSLSLSLLPNPHEESVNVTGDLGEIYQRILEETRRHLSIRPEDRSTKAMGLLFGFLANEMSSYALRGVDITVVKKRLAQQGDLPLEQYQFELHHTFANLMRETDMSLTDMKEVIQRNDAVEHILQWDEHDPNSAIASLYLKMYNRPQNPFVVLVDAEHKGDVIEVNAGWRIYSSEIDLSQVNSPQDVLRAFLGVYGIPFRVKEAFPTKLYIASLVEVYQTMPLKMIGSDLVKKSQRYVDMVEIDSTQYPNYIGRVNFAGPHLQTMTPKFGYFVDKKKYAAAWKTKRGHR